MSYAPLTLDQIALIALPALIILALGGGAICRWAGRRAFGVALILLPTPAALLYGIGLSRRVGLRTDLVATSAVLFGLAWLVSLCWTSDRRDVRSRCFSRYGGCHE